MTDDEVMGLLNRLAGEKVARYQKRDAEYIPPEDLPPNIEGDICALVWYVGFLPSCDELIAHGAQKEQVSAALAKQKASLRIIEPSDLVPIPTNLAAELDGDLRAALAEEGESVPRQLDEKVVKWITEHRVEIYFNEGQHRGRPHVAVVLPDGKISVSLDDPPVLLTPHGYRGEASALKVVKKHLQPLRTLWDETRPDDQKLPIKIHSPLKT